MPDTSKWDVDDWFDALEEEHMLYVEFHGEYHATVTLDGDYIAHASGISLSESVIAVCKLVLVHG